MGRSIDRYARHSEDYTGIPDVALFAVQIGMHPGARAVLLGLLHRRMRTLPVAARVMPKRLHRESASRRRRGPVGHRVLQISK